MRTMLASIVATTLALAPVSVFAAKAAKAVKAAKRQAAPSLTLTERAAAAEASYDDYQYADAAKSLERLLEDPSLTDSMLKQKLRRLLAFSYFWQHREADAKEALHQLFRENDDPPFDRQEIHPDLVRFFDSERSAYLTSVLVTPPSQSPPQQAPIVVAPATADETPKVAAAPPVALKLPALSQTVGDRNPWLRVLSAGIGHFANHDLLAGGLFLGAEVALVATNVVATILWNNLRAPDGDFLPNSQPIPLQVTMDVTALAAISLAVFEIVDAFIWSPARGRATL